MRQNRLENNVPLEGCQIIFLRIGLIGKFAYTVPKLLSVLNILVHTTRE